MYPTVEFMLPDLLIFHESMHIGQISIWRRAAGLPGVPFPDRTPRADCWSDLHERAPTRRSRLSKRS